MVGDLLPRLKQTRREFGRALPAVEEIQPTLRSVYIQTVCLATLTVTVVAVVVDVVFSHSYDHMTGLQSKVTICVFS